MRQRLIYLMKVYMLTVVVFIAAKLVFMLVNYEGHAFGIGDMCAVILHGLTLDLSTSLYFLILPFLTTLFSLWWDDRRLHTFLRIYYGIIATMLMLAFVADTSLYPFWGFKLDASCLQYLETPTEVRASVSGFYMTLRIILLILGSYALYRLYKAIPFWAKDPSRRQAATVTNLLFIPLFIIGIRGGLDESTTNIGQVYFSQNQFLNHSAVNPVFSFLSSFEKTASNIVDYDFFSQSECDTLMKDLYPTTSVNTDTLLTTSRPDIVIVLMESAGDIFEKVMPRLRGLKKEGIDFTACYGNTWRTDRGTVCTYSGYPSFPTRSRHRLHLQRLSLLPHFLCHEDAPEDQPPARYRCRFARGRLSDLLPLWWRHQLHQHAQLPRHNGLGTTSVEGRLHQRGTELCQVGRKRRYHLQHPL